ncbi:MAG: DUF5050 domain-containing protein [Lachnospiraceae bacterium]|nr:DUF5050 domain-containing protein [Lachnospiraceae bacterium]
MSSKTKNTIIVVTTILLLGIILAGSIIFRILGERIPDNDPSVIGNTAGNLNNGGYFAESGDRVYFSNPFDKGSIYSMNPDETDFKKVTSSSSKNILVGGDYLYYYMDTSGGGTGLGYVVKTFGVYRCDKDGRNAKCLDREAAVIMQLVGNYVYYQRYNNKDFTKTYKVKTDKSEQILVSDSIINPAAAANGTIYFNGTEKDHYLYAMDTRNDTAYTIYKGNVWYPQYQDGYIYYMDVGSDYRICRFNPGTNETVVLTNDRVDSFNVGRFNIYYQKNDANAPCLMRMNLDGSNPEVVAYGNFNSINLTSQYAYFRQFGEDQTFYHTPVIGSINVEGFWAAQTAAIENE